MWFALPLPSNEEVLNTERSSTAMFWDVFLSVLLMNLWAYDWTSWTGFCQDLTFGQKKSPDHQTAMLIQHFHIHNQLLCQTALCKMFHFSIIFHILCVFAFRIWVWDRDVTVTCQCNHVLIPLSLHPQPLCSVTQWVCPVRPMGSTFLYYITPVLWAPYAWQKWNSLQYWGCFFCICLHAF